MMLLLEACMALLMFVAGTIAGVVAWRSTDKAKERYHQIWSLVFLLCAVTVVQDIQLEVLTARIEKLEASK